MRGKLRNTGRQLFIVCYLLTIATYGFYFPEKANANSVIFEAQSTATVASGTSITINKPSGVISGDVMIALVNIRGSVTFTPPGGWTSIAGTSNANLTTAAYYRVAGGSEGANYTFSSNSLPGNGLSGAIVSYRGVDNSSPIDVTGGTSTGSSTSAQATSITTSTNRSKVVMLAGADNANTVTFAPPTGMTERADVGTNIAGSNDVSIEVSDKDKSVAGSVGAQTSTVSASSNWGAYQFALKPDSVTHMMLFWDGFASDGTTPLSLPSGWSFVSEAEGKFVRGESAANYGVSGGQNDHNHSMGTPTLGPPSAERTGINGGTGLSDSGHTHGMPTTTSNTATNGNIPAFKTLRLIRYDAGIPNTIPSGGIALFDDSPGIPGSGWTRQAAQDTKVVKVDSSAGATGGSDTHTHSVSWSGSLTAASGELGNFCLLIGCSTVASVGHTHTVSGTATTSSAASNVPPYIQNLLAKADADTPVLSIGITAMFDGAPGGGWVVRSDSGGPYYRKFMRPNSTYVEAGGGASGHTPTGGAKTSGASSGTSSGSTITGTGAAASGHTHVITPVFTTYTSDSLYTGNNDYFLPPYYDVVVAEKVNFIFNHYAWYDDSNAVQVTSRYSGLDVAQDSPILPIPIGYNPPSNGQELRLRIQILVNNSSLANDEMEFRLQFKEDTSTSLTTSTCTDGSWTDVGNNGDSVVWTYAASTPTDGTLLSSGGGTSIMTPTSDSLQRYVKSNAAGRNSGVVSAGQTMEWDYHILNNGANPATQYRFRLVEDSGILLSQYGYTGGGGSITPLCPTLTTRPESQNQLRHGQFFDNTGTEKGFSWAD